MIMGLVGPIFRSGEEGSWWRWGLMVLSWTDLDADV